MIVVIRYTDTQRNEEKTTNQAQAAEESENFSLSHCERMICERCAVCLYVSLGTCYVLLLLSIF